MRSCPSSRLALLSFNGKPKTNGQEINSQRNDGANQPVNREGNGEIGQDVQGSKPGVQSEVEGQNGTKRTARRHSISAKRIWWQRRPK